MLLAQARTGPRLTSGLRQAITLMSLSGADLAAWMTVAGAGTAALRVVPPRREGFQRAIFDPDGLAAPQGSLIAHVLGAIAGLDLAPRPRAIALVLAEALEPTGWLGAPVARIARICGAAEDEVLAVLARVQRIEPAGLFARSLAECLALQAGAEGELTPAMHAVLADLPLLARGDLGAIAAAAGLAPEEVIAAAGRLRGYDPKPGLAFAGFVPPSPPPDLMAEAGGGGWHVAPNPAAPRFEVVPGRNDPSARAIRGALARRADVALAVGQRIAARQGAWFEGGALLPLTSRDLAAGLGLHVATVNRVLAAITLRTPRGTLPLRALTARPVGADGATAARIRARLAELLSGADPRSDRQLAGILSSEGLSVARRTVSKYRAMIAGEGSDPPFRPSADR